MKLNRKVSELKNIGSKIAGRLNQIGIYSKEDLRLHGSVTTHQMLKKEFHNDVLPICYYLYSFEGALQDKHWNEISDRRKQELKAQT